MASSSRTAALVLSGVVVLLLLCTLFAGLGGLVESLRKEHCDRFTRTHARIEAAQRGEAYPGEGREGQDACVHEAEREVMAGGGA